jgi:hypothetical protein
MMQIYAAALRFRRDATDVDRPVYGALSDVAF